MSVAYELIGRLVVAYVRRRFGGDIRTAALGLGALGLLAVAYLLLSGRHRR